MNQIKSQEVHNRPHFGSRSKAARWMCSHQHSFEGRTGDDVIVAGDVDMV